MQAEISLRFQAFYRFFLQKFGQCTVFLKRLFYFGLVKKGPPQYLVAALYAMPKYRLCLPIMSVFVTFDKILSVLYLLFS